MTHVVYAKTNQKINRLGFGAWQLGNGLWGDMSIDEGVLLVKEAIASGVNFFDTAPGYASGMSEIILGKAIVGMRNKIVINTKLGHTAEGITNFSLDSLESQILSSLKRLNTDYLDSVILHNPDKSILAGQTKHFQVLKQLKQSGLIRAYGVSIDTYEELDSVLKHADIDVVEILFNIFFQSPSPLFKEAKKKGISIVTKVPLDSGWLSGKYDEHAVFTGIRARWNQATIQRRAGLVKQIKAFFPNEDLTKLAIGFILSFEEVTAVIPGIKDLNQLHENIQYSNYIIPKDIKQKCIDLYDQQIKNNPLPW